MKVKAHIIKNCQLYWFSYSAAIKSPGTKTDQQPQWCGKQLLQNFGYFRAEVFSPGPEYMHSKIQTLVLHFVSYRGSGTSTTENWLLAGCVDSVEV